MEMNQKTVYKLVVPDEHKVRIKDLLDNEMNKDNGFIHLKDKNDVAMKFYYEDGLMYAERADGDNTIKQEVISMSEASELQKKSRPIKEVLAERIKKDFPEKTQEEVEQDADILSEANESIKNLIKAGVPPTTAKRIIQSVLECEVPPSTPEELAEILKIQIEADDKKEDESS